MKVRFTEDGLIAHAAKSLPSVTALASREPLFDPSLPLPSLPTDWPPSFEDLRPIVPEPYFTHIYHTCSQMSTFSPIALPLIHEVISTEARFEWMMHADLFNPHYRDHIVHQVRVAAMGDLLLHQVIGEQTLLAQAAAVLGPKLAGVTHYPPQFLRLAWWLAALFHDCGYPYQFHCDYFQRLHKVYRVPLGNPAATDWSSCHRGLAKLVGSLAEKDTRNCEQGRHAFISAAELANEALAYEQEAGKGEEKQYRQRRRTLFSLVVKAILRHHGTIPVGFGKNPLGFLLILSDEIHEAERPVALLSTEPPARPGDPGRTVITYRPNEIAAAEARLPDPPGPAPTLQLIYHCRPGATHVRGKPRDQWAANKEKTLKDTLRLGPGEILGDLCVEVSAGP
jgi:hypothetical protein